MTSLQIVEVVLIVLLVIIILFSVIVGPILRKKSAVKREAELEKIIATFKANDKVLLASGIRGYFIKRKGDVLSIEIAKGVIVKVDKHSVMGVYK